MDVLFIPFASREGNDGLIAMAARWQQAYATHSTGGVQDSWATQIENRVFTPGMQVLDGISSSDVFYVLAHGQGNDFVCARDQIDTAVLDARALATRVMQSGLPKAHKRCILNICNTNQTLDSFAGKFKKRMVEYGYTALDVFYYMGSVSVPTVSPGQNHVSQKIIMRTPDPSITMLITPMGIVPVNQLTEAAPYLFRV